MTSHDRPVPTLVPQLSRGKHRNPRKGACFMELASYLAGERWSDHPSCTHPLLATMARLVNDHTTDAGRDRLGRLVPSVIGLTSHDPRVDVELTLRAATTALPVAAAERQRVLAVAVLAAERMAARLDAEEAAAEAEAEADASGVGPTGDRAAGWTPPAGRLSERSRRALAQAPEAERWARSFTREIRTTPKGFYRYAAPNTVRQAVVGISQAYVADPDALLHDMLAGGIADCERLIGAPQSSRERVADDEAWAAACALTGARPVSATARPGAPTH
jgi:hypothetical protein